MAGNEKQLRAFLRRAVVNFSRDRRSAANIRWFSENLPKILISVGIELLLDSDDTFGIRFLVTQLLKTPSFFQIMTDPWQYSSSDAIRLGRRVLSIDRTLDIKLARSLPGRNGEDSPWVLTGLMAERALEILDEISVGRRVVPVLNHLTRHPDTRISSKSTLLVGKRIQNISWARRLQVESLDPRIRANALEAFWGIDSRAALQLFRASLRDPHNRVVGNSMMGLHLAGDQDVPVIVGRFANDYKPEFRMTTAWIMGKIGDPEYVTPLGSLVRDSHPSVRSAALKSLKELRQLQKWRPDPEIEAPLVGDSRNDQEPDVSQTRDPEIAIGLWLNGAKVS